LLLQARRGVAFQSWLRGSADGIDAEACRRLLARVEYLRPQVLAHVYLHAKAERRLGGRGGRILDELKSAGFGADHIRRNVAALGRFVHSLRWQAPRDSWRSYAPAALYGESEAAKRTFVERVLRGRRWRCVWDLGCNTGTYARLAAAHADYVLAFDSDDAVVDALYRSLAEASTPRLLPLVVDLADPSPQAGWRAAERRSLEGRGRPDLVLCLALLHHLVISAGLPLAQVIEWIGTLGGNVVVEFVTRADPMVLRLLQQRGEDCEDYHLEVFEREISTRFLIAGCQHVAGGSRILYHAVPRGL